VKAYVVELRVNPKRSNSFRGGTVQHAVFSDRDEALEGFELILNSVKSRFKASFVVSRLDIPDDALVIGDIRDVDDWIGTVTATEIDTESETVH